MSTESAQWVLASPSPGSLDRTSGSTVTYTPPGTDANVNNTVPSAIVIATVGTASARIELPLTLSLGTTTAPPALGVSPAPGAATPPGAADPPVPASNISNVRLLAGIEYGPSIVDGTGSAARFVGPGYIARGSQGNLYVTDDATVRKVTKDGAVTTLAGKPGAYGHVDGAGAAARFDDLEGIVFNVDGNIYVADKKTIRRITQDGTVTTFAGNQSAITRDGIDGNGTAASFTWIGAMAADNAGNLYVVDGDVPAIRRITPSGDVATIFRVAGLPIVGRARGIAIDAAGNIYYSDWNFKKDCISCQEFFSSAIRKITPAGVVTTLAGTPDLIPGNLYSQSLRRDGTGSEARFSSPGRIAIDGSGTLFVMDGDSIRKVTREGVVTTVAGTRSGNLGTDGPDALFSTYDGITVDPDGILYVSGNYAIRRVQQNGDVVMLAGRGPVSRGSGKDGTGPESGFGYISGGLVSDPAGNLYVADDNCTIRQITPLLGAITTIVGSAGDCNRVDGDVTKARFARAAGLARDGSGNLYVTGTASPIRKINRQYDVISLAQSSPGGALETVITADQAGNVYVPGTDGIAKITPAGTASTFATLPTDGLPRALTTDSEGNVFAVTNAGILKFTPAGARTVYAAANLPSTRAMTTDRLNNLYVLSTVGIDVMIQKITPDNQITTVYKTPDPDAGPRVSIYFPNALAMFDATTLAISNGRGIFLLKLP
jgi:hypothetical protein